MSLLEPPEGLVPEEEPVVEEPEFVPGSNQDAALIPVQYIRKICNDCRRPLFEVQNEDGTWKHADARIDVPTNPAHHKAELYVEAPVPWGFQEPKGRSNFEVNSGPSKVRDGWSGGGVA